MELSRLLLGFVVAVSVPLSIPAMRRNLYAVAAFSLMYAAYSSAWVVNRFSTILICATAATMSLILSHRLATDDPLATKISLYSVIKTGSLRPKARVKLAGLELKRYCLMCADRLDIVAVVLLIGIVVCVASALYEPGSLSSIFANHRLSLMLSGALIAVFAGNELVLVAIKPYLYLLKHEGENVGTIVPTGLHIGWIERMIVFSFIAAGEPEAAALAVTAKSLIRIPEMQRHAGVYAQYVVVGTLSNLLVAMLAAMLARVSIGLSPL